MADLSPAAHAVLTAVTWKKYDVPPEGLPTFAEEMAPLIAAALRAAADQVVPLTKTPWGTTLIPVLTAQESRDWLLAIAAELEGDVKSEGN